MKKTAAGTILLAVLAGGLWVWSPWAEPAGSSDSRGDEGAAADEAEPDPVIGGRVIDGSNQPVEGARVTLVDTEGERVAATRTDEDGDFGWPDVSPGEYRIGVEHEGFVVAGPPPAREANVEVPPSNERDGPVELELRILRPATVEGRVLAAGEPLADASISVYYLHADGLRGPVEPFALSGAASTGEDGRFTIEDVVPGRLRLVAEPSGRPSRESREYYVESGRTLDGITIDVSPTGKLAGTVVEANGESPVPEAEVRLRGVRRDLERQVTVGSEGAFEFESLQTGRYLISARAPGFHVGTADDVEVEAGETSEARIELQEGSGLFGRVVDAEGRPVERPFVQFRRSEGRGRWLRGTPDGRFEWSKMPEGNWSVRAFHPEHAQSSWVDIESGRATRVEMGRGGRVVGRVVDTTGAPVTDARVGVGAMTADGPRPYGPGRIDKVETDDNGRFVFESLRPGRYEFRAKSERGTSPNSSMVTVQRGGESGGIELVIGLDGTVAGVVRKASDGSPVAGANVRLHAMTSPFEGHATTTDDQGRFELQGVPAGRRSLRIEADGFLARVASGISVPSGGTTHRDIDLHEKKKGERFGFQGIGATLTQTDDGVRVRGVLPEGGAAKHGLKKGDYIRSVDRESVDDVPLPKVIQKIRGRGGEPVQLTIERDGRKKRLEIVRERVVVDEGRN